MKEKILQLKKLNAAYIAALEFDYCPDVFKIKRLRKLHSNVGVSDSELSESLTENQGRRPDEIASEMSDLIKTL